MSYIMASNRDALTQAYAKHEALLDEGSFSNPLSERHLGVITGWGNLVRPNTNNFQPIKFWTETLRYLKEGQLIVDRARKLGFGATILQASAAPEVVDFCNNPALTDLVFVGHGTLASFQIFSKSRVSWQDLSEGLDHLKTGRVVQRHCGLLPLVYNIPLGTFAARDQRDVIAAPGQIFDPMTLDDRRENAKLTRVFDEAHVGMEALRTFVITPDSIDAGTVQPREPVDKVPLSQRLLGQLPNWAQY